MDEGNQVHGQAAVHRLALLHAAGPGDMVLNNGRFFLIKQVGIPLVAQHGQAHLFVQNFAAEWVHHTHIAVAHGAHHGLVQAAPLDQLGNQHPLVDDVNLKPFVAETAVFIRHFTRVHNLGLKSLRAEILGEQLKLAAGGHIVPIQNANLGATGAAGLAVRIEQNMEHAVARG